jgi:hypothetical protein
MEPRNFVNESADPELVRYADDFVILMRGGVERTGQKVKQMLEGLALKLNEDKTQGQSHRKRCEDTTDSDQHPHHVPSTRQRLLRSDREAVVLADSDRAGPDTQQLLARCF